MMEDFIQFLLEILENDQMIPETLENSKNHKKSPNYNKTS